MTIFGKHIMHKWAHIETIEKTKFMETTFCEYQPTRYRVCEECEIIQEHNYDSGGGWWWEISENRQRIFWSHLYKENERWILDKKAGVPPKFSLNECREK